MSVVFQNPGVLSRKSITAFGVSSKENAGAIGYFGTGLKYAIAVLLRLGQRVTIWSGGQVYRFGTSKRKVRVHDFDFVTLNGRALDFTTEVGKTWEPWMALRELYCNCVDERGTCYSTPMSTEEVLGTVPGQLSITAVIVEGEAFEAAWRDRNKVILSTEPRYKGHHVWVHPGKSEYLYYKGIRVLELPQPSVHTYNLQGQHQLTEDRTIASVWNVLWYLAQDLLEATDPEVIREAVLAGDGHLEHSLSYSGAPGDVFLSVVVPLARTFDPSLSAAALATCRSKLRREQASENAPLPALDEARLRRAVGFLNSLGYRVDEYPIRVTDFAGDLVLGAADDGVIYLSRRAMMMGTKMVAGTLLEEYLHLKHGLLDESRGLQNWLIDALMSLGERVTGEPL